MPPHADAHEQPVIAPEVAEALAGGQGVVALESTLIAQGLPWPENLETARDAEAAVRRSGAIPATIAVLGGTVRIGLKDVEIEWIARTATRPDGNASNSDAFLKASRRDLGAAVAGRRNAATTVSATLWLARRAGIGVLATGGLGGVHRDASRTFDVSTDLDELARADGIVVVCSGVKSILDVPATLEALETRGVPVVGYRTDEFPGFTTASSGLALDTRVESPSEAAALARAHRSLGLPCAIVLAQPVPSAEALDPGLMEAVLAAAMAEAQLRGVTGKAVTPFLLARLRDATGGKSLRANTALVVQNAALAGEVAAALAGGMTDH
jgi:pseudouridine-5'-phosphate glycosidase